VEVEITGNGKCKLTYGGQTIEVTATFDRRAEHDGFIVTAPDAELISIEPICAIQVRIRLDDGW